MCHQFSVKLFEVEIGKMRNVPQRNWKKKWEESQNYGLNKNIIPNCGLVLNVVSIFWKQRVNEDQFFQEKVWSTFNIEIGKILFQDSKRQKVSDDDDNDEGGKESVYTETEWWDTTAFSV